MFKRISRFLLVLAGVAAATFAAVPVQADGYHHRDDDGYHSRDDDGYRHRDRDWRGRYFFGPPAFGLFSAPRRHRGPIIVYEPLVVAPGTVVILSRLSPRDRLYVVSALEDARTGQHVEWVDPDIGTHYTVTPTRTYYANAGQPCREYSMTGDIGGHPQELVGTACRQADGSWREVK